MPLRSRVRRCYLPPSIVVALAVGSSAPAPAQIVFDAPQILTVGVDPRSLVAADIDGNGTPDLVAGGRDTDILFGDGAGTFSAPLSLGTPTSDLVAGDFEADGLPDLVFAEWTEVVLRLGDGRGGFSASAIVPIPPLYEVDMEAADMNGDGRLDLVLAGTYSVRIHHGDGAGGLGSGVELSVPYERLITTIAVADFDADGRPDIAAISDSNQELGWSDVVVLLQALDGSFPVTGQFSARGASVQVLTPADFTGDGRIDLVAGATANGGAVRLFVGDGAGGFSLAGSAPEGRAMGAAAADFDGDGRLDLAMARLTRDYDSGDVAVFRGTGGSLVLEKTLADRREKCWEVAAADFDGDGTVDLALSRAQDSTSGRVEAYRNVTPQPCQSGTVNLGAKPRTDVLFVNDSTGGPERRIRLLPHEPMTIFMAAPPLATGVSPFALGAWAGSFGAETSRVLPFGIGATCFPLLASQGPPYAAVVWNNTGKNALGRPTNRSTPAPSIVLHLPRGVRRAATFYLQGVIADPGSAASKPASVTNGVTVEIR